MKKDRFLLVHNISEDNLDRVMDLGGMVCPSLAFITPDSKFSYYGAITLIADSSLADPQEQPVFDADIFSPRYPDKKVEVSRERADAYLRNIVDKINSRYGTSIGNIEISGLCSYFYENDKRALKDYFYNDNLLVLMASEKHGVKIEQEVVPICFRNRFSEIKEVREFVSRLNGDFDKIVDSQGELLDIIDKHYDRVLASNNLSRVAKIFAGNESRKIKDMIFNGEFFGFSDNDSLSTDFKANPPRNKYLSGSTLSISKSIDKIRGEKPFTSESISEIVNDVFKNIVSREYFCKVIEKGVYAGGIKKVDYNLSNILREMKSKLRSEGSFYLGVGNLKSLVAKRYRHMDSIREDVGRIVGQSVYEGAMDEISGRLRDIISRVIESDGLDKIGNVMDRFHFVGSAVFDYVQSKGNIDNVFSRAVSSDRELKRDFAELIKDLKNVPSVYFEAKIQRIVCLDEFHTAVIPSSTPKEIVSGLVERGLKIKKYNEPDERLNILSSMMLSGKVKEVDVSMGM